MTPTTATVFVFFMIFSSGAVHGGLTQQPKPEASTPAKHRDPNSIMSTNSRSLLALFGGPKSALAIKTITSPMPEGDAASSGATPHATKPRTQPSERSAADTSVSNKRIRGSAAVTAAQPSSLHSCLSATQGLSFLAASSQGFSDARTVWNLRTLSSPTFITFPQTTAQVAAVVKCSRQFKKQVVARSGGHSYEGYGVQTNKVIVDLSKMARVKLWSDKSTATIEAGARLGPVYLALWKQGQVGFPGGVCPAVGSGGHFLGGGFGMLARKYGLASDRIIAVRMVTASGDIITASKNQHPDLLWACKGGGGGNFGIVTSFTVRVAKVPSQVTVIDYEWAASPDATRGAVEWYQSVMLQLPSDLTTDLFMGYGAVQLHGLYLGTADAARAIMSDSSLTAKIGSPRTANIQQMSYIDAVLEFASQSMGLRPYTPDSLGLGPGVSISERTPFKAKSNFIKRAIPSKGIDVMIARLNEAQSQGVSGWLQFHAYGGTLNLPAAEETAFVHRDALANIQWYVSWTDASQEQRSLDWIRGLWQDMQPYVDPSAYANYIDRDLGEQSGRLYFGTNLERLQAVKQTYDPSNFFSFPWGIKQA